MVDECASNSPEHGDPANMAQPSNADSSLLEALPDELLMEVFEQFSFYHLDRTATFHSLCLVSKRIDLIARPYLFKKIQIRGTATLVKLHHTIARNQHLFEHIKDLDIEFYIRHLFGTAEREKLRAYWYQLVGNTGPETSLNTVKDCDVISILLYELLAGSINLSSLGMDIEHYDFHRHQNFSTFFDRVSRATRPSATAESAVFLPQLKNLTLKSLNAISVEGLGRFLDLPSLRTVRAWGDDGNWWRLAPHAHMSGSWPQLQGERRAHRNITTLNLCYTTTCQFDVEDIAQLFPCLEVFKIENVDDDLIIRRLKYYITHGSRRDLSSALGKLTALRVLDITMYTDCAIAEDLYNDIGGTLGPANVLSLAQLPNLQHIRVPMYMFVHLDLDPPYSFVGKAAIPREVLPQTLRTLELVITHKCKDSYGGEACGWDLMYDALEFLESLLDGLSCFPHLQSVACSFNYGNWGPPFPSTFILGQVTDRHENSHCPRLRTISASFSKQNVEFFFSATDGYD